MATGGCQVDPGPATPSLDLGEVSRPATKLEVAEGCGDVVARHERVVGRWVDDDGVVDRVVTLPGYPKQGVGHWHPRPRRHAPLVGIVVNHPFGVGGCRHLLDPVQQTLPFVMTGRAVGEPLGGDHRSVPRRKLESPVGRPVVDQMHRKTLVGGTVEYPFDYVGFVERRHHCQHPVPGWSHTLCRRRLSVDHRRAAVSKAAPWLDRRLEMVVPSLQFEGLLNLGDGFDLAHQVNYCVPTRLRAR